MLRTSVRLATLVALLAVSAIAQTARGTEPLSKVPTNVMSGDTHTTWSPRLPTPVVDDNAPPLAFLKAAQQAVAANRTGEAQEALERAESRALDRAVKPSKAGQASRQPLIRQIAEARKSLASGDRAMTVRLIDGAMKNPDASEKD